MTVEKSAPGVDEQLAQALARIAELERANAELPHAILESITDAFVAVDRNFRYTWANPEAERFLSLSREQLLGHSLWEVFPDAAGTSFEAQLARAMAEKAPVDFEYRFAAWDRWFHNRAYPTRDGGLALYFRDITGQKRTQADLRRQSLILGQVHDSIIATDLAGAITQWNPGAEKTFGYTGAEAIGQHLSLLYFEEERGDVESGVLDPLLREGQREIEGRNRRKSGEECFIRLSLSLLRDEHGAPYGILAVATDVTERKRAERALRESEEHCRRLTEAMLEVAFVGGPEGIPGDSPASVHPDDAPAVEAKWAECVRKGERFHAEYRRREPDGEYRWQVSQAVPVRGGKEWVGTRTDIHDLRRSEERLRLASQAVDGFIYDWNPLTGVVERFGNPEKIVGGGPDEPEPTERWWDDRIHPEDRAASAAHLLKTLPADCDHFETEFRFRHSEGHWVYLADSGYVIRGEDGLPVRVVGSTRDVTARRRLESEIEEQSRRLKFQAHILETTHDAVIALAPDLSIRYCNAAAERMYGVRLEEVLGKPLLSVHGYAWLSPEDEELCMTDLRGRGSWQGEYIHILRDGTHLVVNCTVNVLSAESGGGIVSVIRDVTGRKRSELQARSHAQQLGRANDDLLHFAYAVSHDLQAPVRTVTAFSQMLELKHKASLGDAGSQMLAYIVEAGARMNTLIRDLLEFAKVAGGEVRLSEEVQLAQTLETALAGLRGGIEETGAIVTHDALPTIKADPGQMVQLLQNLIGNSLKYRKADTPPRIHISAERIAEEWKISVRDNGIGFEPRHSERIFGVFQRLHGREVAGTGIGLTICKRIVERRGGRIEARGKPGEGATFSFSIPDSDAAIQAAPPMDWDRVPRALVEPPAPTDAPAQTPAGPFDEAFRTLDLAPCLVRDFDGTISIWTQGMEKLSGWRREEAAGRRAHELLAIEFPQPLHEIEAELMRSDEWSGQLRAMHRGGGTIWLASHWTLYRDGSGRPQSVIEVLSDITALKTAEEALRRSNELRDLALRAGQMGIWSWDSASDAVEWDSTVETLMGMAPGAFERSYGAFRSRIHPDDISVVEEKIRKAFQSGPEYEVEHRVLHADGSYRWWRGQGQVTYRAAEPAGLVGVVWDITARKQAELDRLFLLDLSAKLTKSGDPLQLAEMAMAETGTYLGISRCTFSEVDLTASKIESIADWHTDGPSILGTHPLEAYGGAAAELAADRVVAIVDARADERTAADYESAYRPLGIVASLAVPLHRQSVWNAAISASHSDVRHWQEREISLVRGVAERLWPAFENARLLREAREKQEQFEGTFEQAAVGMAHVAPDGRWLLVNQRVCEITGYTREELLASRFQDITHPDDLDADIRQYAALKRGETDSYSIEKRYFRRDGSIVWINLTVALVRDDRGEPRYAISVIEDISARRKTAEELERSNRLAALRLREIDAIYAQAPVGLAFLDRELRYVRINEYLARINGFPVADHIGRRVSEVLPRLGAQLEPVFRNVIETRSPVFEREIVGTKEGSPDVEFAWLVSYFPVEADDGSVLGLNGVVQDITERKRVEAEQRESAERLRIATSAARLGIYSWNKTGDRAYWENDRMYEITGRRREDGPTNRTEFLETLIHPDDVEGFRKSMRDAVARKDDYRSECRIRRPDGETRQVELSGRFDFGPDGAPVRLIGVMADITDLREPRR